MVEQLRWKVAIKQLFAEVLNNLHDSSALKIPFQICYDSLLDVAACAIELDDFQLNQKMLRLGLYSISDPASPEYNADLTHKLLKAKTAEEFAAIRRAA